jgi:hypothetical protein
LRLWRWGNDTYHTGYRIFTVAFTKAFDCYVFHYKEGAYIPRHKDPSCGRRIYRLNFELVKADRGGEFVCAKTIFRWWRIVLFRADTSYHYVTPIEKGRRILLSFGFKLR